MGLMELGCKLEDFARPAQPAASNRLRCRAQVVSERYLRETFARSAFACCLPVHGKLSKIFGNETIPSVGRLELWSAYCISQHSFGCEKAPIRTSPSIGFRI